jgi:hypothetical protein
MGNFVGEQLNRRKWRSARLLEVPIIRQQFWSLLIVATFRSLTVLYRTRIVRRLARASVSVRSSWTIVNQGIAPTGVYKIYLKERHACATALLAAVPKVPRGSD